MSDLIGRIASTLADARGRKTLTVLELDRIPPAERETAMVAVLGGSSSDSLLARWNRKWLKGTIRGSCVAVGTLSAGIAFLVATEGGAAGFVLVFGATTAVLSIRGFNDHFDLPARIAWPAELADATTLSITITPEDRLAHDLWTRAHQLWVRVSEQPNALPRAELSTVLALAYRVQAEIARLMAAERQEAADEAKARTRAACDALRQLERAVADALGRARWPAAPTVELGFGIGSVPEPEGVLSEIDATAPPETAPPDLVAAGEPRTDRYWQLYQQSNRAGRV